ncbi:hypothetical protein OG589_39155 [Sphaerisporangium sp. NBC_01403]|uniref:hypothetical protein n=1 Tax=Sphaerisporangium sp. NBC_01403 TaxID=2903599 RepID=UPI003250E874
MPVEAERGDEVFVELEPDTMAGVHVGTNVKAGDPSEWGACQASLVPAEEQIQILLYGSRSR